MSQPQLEPSSHALLRDPSYGRLKAHLIESTGLAYYTDKDDDLASRIGRRLSQLGLCDCATYLNLLLDAREGESELDEIIAELTIGETYFFRHQEQFHALRDHILPDLIERNRRTQRLRIWSAGCASGAEPYSLAILLRRQLAHRLEGWEISILGTDINKGFLAQAREGKYGDWALRSTADELKESCFSRSHLSSTIHPAFKRGVSFQYHNLVKHPFPSLLNNLSAFDLILCRNAMIYFSQEIIRRVVAQFHESLVDGGWLVVGYAEHNQEVFRAFRTVNAFDTTLYQKDHAAGLDRQRDSLVGVVAGLPHSTLHPATSWPAVLTTPDAPAPPAARKSRQASRRPRRTPSHARPSLDLATVRLLANRGEWEEAVHCCEKVLATDSVNPAAHFYHALVLEQMGHHAEAERSLRRAIYLDRGFVLAHYYLGLFLQKKGDLFRAMRSFENVVKMLGQLDGKQAFPDGDGMTVADLREMTAMHLEVLRGA